MRLALVTASLLATTACHGAGAPAAPTNRAPPTTATAPDAPLVFGRGPLVLEGTLGRELHAASDNRPFVLAPGNVAAIELRRYQGEDAAAPLLLRAEATLPPGTLALPRRYEVHGELVRDGGTILVSVEFTSGGTARPRQLVSEYRNELTGDATTLDLVVSGLEACDAPDAGGFCG